MDAPSPSSLDRHLIEIIGCIGHEAAGRDYNGERIAGLFASGAVVFRRPFSAAV
jgi:hypothetical protein